MTGYPSIDKPWLKYYPINRKKFIHCGLYQYLHQNNLGHEYDVAMMYMGKKWTFGDFFTWVNRMSGAFIASGICAGDKVIVLGLNTPDIICAIYALNNIGAVCCIEYITQKEQELENACQSFHATAAVVIDAVIERYYDSLKKAGVEQIFVSRIADSMPLHLKAIMLAKAPRRQVYQLSKAKSHKEVKSYSWNGDETAIILSTSGTTGIPKKAELSNNALNALAYQAGYVDLGLTYGTTLLSPCPPFLAYGISLSTHLPLCNGVAVISFPSPDPKMVTKQFAKYKPNFFICGRTFLDCISSDSAITKMDLSFVKAICIGGEAVSQDYRDKMSAFIRERGSDGIIITGYGMTECAASSTIGSKNANREGSVGIPLCDVNVKIVDTETGKELGYGEEGEIVINSPCIMNDYFDNPQETTNTIEKDVSGKIWMHTGDLGKIDSDGFVYVVGRMKRIFITIDPSSNAQVKLYPDYIESLINQFDEIEDCAVIVDKHENRKNIPIAFLRIKNNCKVDTAQVDEKLKSMTSLYNCPQKYYLVEEIPLLANGKIDYQKLLQMHNKIKSLHT